MKENIKAQFDNLFDRYDSEKNKMKEEKEKTLSKEEIFHNQFYELREKVIRPAFEKLGQLLTERGHEYKIEKTDYSISSEYKYEKPSITMEIYPDGLASYKNPTSYSIQRYFPHVGFVAEKLKFNTYFHVSTISPNKGGHAGSEGEYSLDEITEDLIFEKCIKVFKEIF